jgi:putative hydrolase of the HAD superfamily
MLSNFKRPDLVLLDLDNTLYDYAPAHHAGMKAVRAKLHQSLGINAGDFNSAFEAARSRVKERLHGTASSHNRLLYFKDMIEALGLRTQPLLSLDLEQMYWRAFLAEATLLPGVIEFLEELRILEIPRVLITDLNTQIQFRKLAYFELDSSFEFVVTSEEVGCEKPDPRIFNYAAAKLAERPQSVWMIGDDIERDIRGAKEALGCVTFQRNSSPGGILRSGSVDKVFNDFAELLAILKATDARRDVANSSEQSSRTSRAA